MTRTMVMTVMAAISLSGPALGGDQAKINEIRARLVATPMWQTEWERQGRVQHGKVWFTEQDGKLIGNVDTGFRCAEPVTVRPDGLDLNTCTEPDKQFFVAGDEFKGTFGGYKFTMRRMPQ
jgi:hypothetical protein